MNLSEREQEVLRQMREARVASIRRKRSWRLSERSMAVAEVNRVTLKILRSATPEEKNDE